MNQLTVINSSIVAEINREHALAQQNANIAIEHGKRAGELLLQAKELLPHGSFGAWLSENVKTVSDRQARRYMQAAKGLPMPVRSIGKSDTVSVLDSEAIAKIVADTVAKQLESEREKMRLEIENEIKNKELQREKELAECADRIRANYAEFMQNRDGLINELIAMKSLHVGAYWERLIDIHNDKLTAEVLFADYATGDMSLNEAVVTTDVVHANLVAQIEAVEMLRNQKDWTGLEFESFDDFVAKNEIDLEHFERYKQMPIYSEIVTSIQAFKEFEATQTA